MTDFKFSPLLTTRVLQSLIKAGLSLFPRSMVCSFRHPPHYYNL